MFFSFLLSILANLFSKSIWAISDHSLIYQNKGFMDTLKDAFFDTKGGFGFKYLDQFKSTLEGREEPELTIPIVALGATGVCFFFLFFFFFFGSTS